MCVGVWCARRAYQPPVHERDGSLGGERAYFLPQVREHHGVRVCVLRLHTQVGFFF